MSYRITHWFEDCACALCISCNGSFILHCDEVYEYCPKCGEATEPVKRNPRYNLPDPPRNWKLDSDGKICETFSPHLILETASRIAISLSNVDFTVVHHPPKRLPWSLHCHTALSSTMPDGRSASVWFVERYNELIEKYDHVRLRLMNGNKSRIIKEK